VYQLHSVVLLTEVRFITIITVNPNYYY